MREPAAVAGGRMRLEGIASNRPENAVKDTPRKVLIVEDDPDMRETLRFVLEMHGCQIEEATDGAEGLEKIRRCRPDIALVDIGLPVLDGYGLARAVRGSPDGQGMFLVALTGYGQAEDLRRAREAGFDVHLVKPVYSEELLQVIASEPVKESR